MLLSGKRVSISLLQLAIQMDGLRATRFEITSHSSSQPMEARVFRHTVIQLKVVVILQLRPTETTSANGAMCAMSFSADMRL